MTNKLYHKIGEVSKDTGLTHSTIRSWGKEISALRPSRSSGGHRYYSNDQVDMLLYLKRLINEEGYKFKGAKKRLLTERQQMKSVEKQDAPPEENNAYQEVNTVPLSCDMENLKQYLKNELKTILSILQG